MDATMMNCGPWLHHQQLLHQLQMEQHPYYQYAINDLHAYYSSSDHQEEETDHTGDEMPSETSGDQSPNGEVFRLAFAASQWSKLVLNAEGLFNKLMTNNALSSEEQHLLKSQIEQWLCLKQEYEECIGTDDSSSLPGFTENVKKSLERIEEVTETDEKTDESSNWQKSLSKRKSFSGSESEVSYEEDHSETESENSDFLGKLDEYMKKFKMDTDKIIDTKQNECLLNEREDSPELQLSNTRFVPIVKPIPIRNPTSRRMSILPHSEMSNEFIEFQKQQNAFSVVQKSHQDFSKIIPQNSERQHKESEAKGKKSFEDDCTKVMTNKNSIIDTENYTILKMLKMTNEEKKLHIKDIQLNLELIHKQVRELQNIITIKEQFIEDMLKNSDARDSAKQKFQEKRDKYAEMYRDVEEVLNYKLHCKDTDDESNHQEEIEKCERALKHYEKKLRDTKIIKQLAGNSSDTISYIENSLKESKKRMEKLKQQLVNEEKQKQCLEHEILENKQQIIELEEKHKSSLSKLKEKNSESHDETSKSKIKLKNEDRDKNLLEENEKISRIGNLLKEQLDGSKLDNMNENDTLRREIHNLRCIRDKLIDMKCKYTSDQVPVTIQRQRQVLLISEYVETIDAMIEQKNVMICNDGDLKKSKLTRNDEHIPIMNRLENLSHDELVTLFYKYFYKVIDLKDSSKNLEIQNATLEETLKNKDMEYDAKLFRLHRSYERQLNLLFNYYAEETSSSSHDNRIDRNRDTERLIKENQALRQRLAHFDSLLKASANTKALASRSIKNTEQSVQPEQMQIVPSDANKKVGRDGKEQNNKRVTRHGNKLVFNIK
ncbi:kinesin-like protein costa [Trichogramma pretiosum]|uniref:kinesin-like protein costa n=1 Tax=Trichogramma pretiosum TaxID=7493 RepID=UPI0006C9C3FF|nr:kinesin-like protein costa [Trichogramma pretiosum]